MSDRRATITDTAILHMRELLERKRQDHDKLGKEIESLETDIQKYERMAKSKNGDPRRPRGENRTAIRKYYEENEGTGLTLKKLAEEIGLPLSSVSVAVNKLVKAGKMRKDDEGYLFWGGEEESSDE